MNPNWARDGADWPNRAASRFVHAGGLRWHVQMMGQGPPMLLLHGTGAATHSWAGLLPLLAPHFTLVAPDLPGHGFTDTPPARGLSLPGMAAGVTALLKALGIEPAFAVGHSAGGAIAARMVLDQKIAPRALVGLNAALMPFDGIAGFLFTPIARLLVTVPPVTRLFAWRGSDPRFVERLLRDTGSTIGPEGAAFYARLVGSPKHVAAALGMMANWDLRPLAQALPQLPVPLVLVVGSNDRTTRPSDSRRVRAMVPGSTIVTLPGLGHLAHEERPDHVASILIRLLETTAA